MKSISKSYGVPGLRLGVIASSDRSMISNIRKEVSIWNINSFAEYYMQIFGKYEDSYRLACDKFKEERDRFENILKLVPYLRHTQNNHDHFNAFLQILTMQKRMVNKGLQTQYSPLLETV